MIRTKRMIDKRKFAGVNLPGKIIEIERRRALEHKDRRPSSGLDFAKLRLIWTGSTVM